MAVFRVPDPTPSSETDEEADQVDQADVKDALGVPAGEAPPEASRESADPTSVFDDWQWDLYQTIPPSRRMVDRLTELLSGVENWKAEVQVSTGELENRLVGELRILEAKIEGLRNSGNEDREDFKQALQTIWRQTEQLGSAVEVWAGGAQVAADDRTKLVQALELIGQRVAQAEDTVLDRQELFARQLAALVEALNATQEQVDLVGREADARLQQALGAIDARLAATQEAQGAAAAAALKSTQAGLVRGLEAVKEALESLESEFSQALSTAADEREDLKSLVSALAVEREDLKTLVSALSIEREDLRSLVSVLGESFKQLKSDVRDTAGQSEVRIRQHLESVESRTLAAISDLSLALMDEHRATKLELQNRIDRGVREPLKNTVSLLGKQLSDIESTVQMTFDILRNADLTLKIDSVNALMESRFRKGQPHDFVELPSPGKGDGPEAERTKP